MYSAKCTTEVNNKIPVILPQESDIYCIENYWQIRWTTAESNRALQKISKIGIFFTLKDN